MHPTGLCQPALPLSHRTHRHTRHTRHTRLAAEVDRLERAGRAVLGPGREEVMDGMYGRLEPRPQREYRTVGVGMYVECLKHGLVAASK